MLKLKDLSVVESTEQLRGIPEGKVLINTNNAHLYNIAQKVLSIRFHPAHLQ